MIRKVYPVSNTGLLSINWMRKVNLKHYLEIDVPLFKADMIEKILPF
jgi:hypothetical protein